MSYAQMQHSFERAIQDAVTDVATRNNTSVAAVCQGFADHPEDAVQQLDLSRVNPALYEALTNAQ
ncbi:hypothetical protein AWV79_35510 [Cupriavidus sp. UYMMa02A]|nr:hypothetical protein AWV79_35510 [Cupriavidus sp. UYMMa02A]